MKNELQRVTAVWSFLAKHTELSEYVTAEDIMQFKRRISAEGLTFATVTLPALGKALDRSFETGCFECPTGWSMKLNAAYPAFLHKAWEVLFDENGAGRWLVTDVSNVLPLINLEADQQGLAVHCIRQLTYAFYKYEQPWTDEQAENVFEGFRAAERELIATVDHIKTVGEGSMFINGISLGTYLDRAARLLDRFLSDIDLNQIEPCYGTGATADHASPWGRWQNPRFIDKLHRKFDYAEWFVSGINGCSEYCQALEADPSLRYPGVPKARAVLVPKDSRGPRFISAEPREFMYIQQGPAKAIKNGMERYPNVKRQVSIIDQRRNQFLARLASLLGMLASLDLKEASDRVSLWLVRRIFPQEWVEVFESCRSEATVLPCGEIIPLTKFAPMGSACCFPVEALCFWALANAASTEWTESRCEALFSHSKSIDELPEGLINLGGPDGIRVNDVCVYGDDIIVPVSQVPVTIALLEMVGLKVNQHKSFTKGPFRESCGGDYYLGRNVAPVRVKHRLGGNDIESMFRAKDVCNRISLVYGACSPSLATLCRDLYQELYDLKLPLLACNEGEGSAGLVLYDYHSSVVSDLGLTLRKRDGEYQAIKVRYRRETPSGITRRFCKGAAHLGQPDYFRCQQEPDYCRTEIRVLAEFSEEETRDLGWSSVLRSFHTSGGRGGTDKYAPRRRNRYKLAWIAT